MVIARDEMDVISLVRTELRGSIVDQRTPIDNTDLGGINLVDARDAYPGIKIWDDDCLGIVPHPENNRGWIAIRFTRGLRPLDDRSRLSQRQLASGVEVVGGKLLYRP